MTQVHTIAQHDLGLVEQPPAEEINLAEEVHIIANEDVRMAADVRHALQVKVFAHGAATAAKERLADEVTEQQGAGFPGALLKVEAEPKHRMKKAR